ncbi:flagellar export chaperone FlgN [Georgenia sp. H159]|uniref:flagellar export chaperone FlgN n=1 Tax=Georgenia sp. H159 TaxID=3076115 RepID=UPI002D796FEC|nr:flagellar export chaperone FlgN [Georgenia sp. H159]
MKANQELNATGTALRSLSDLLWRERDLLESLHYRLEVEQLLLGAGRTRLLPIAAREVDEALAGIRNAELARAVEVRTVASVLDLPDGASLLDIAGASPAPWEGILLEHRTAILGLTSEIGSAAEANRDVLASVHHATQETLMSLHESVDVYDVRGTTARRSATARLVDESL